MRVLHVLQDAHLGGGPGAVEALVIAQRAAGLDPVVLTPEGPMHWQAEDFVYRSAWEGLQPSIVRCLRRLRPDVVHVHGRRAWRAAMGPARQHRLPLVSTIHGWHARTLAQRLWVFVVERRLARLASAVIHLSSDQQARAHQAGVQAPVERLIPNALDAEHVRRHALSRTDALGALDLSTWADRKVVGTIARLVPVKRVELLAEAAAEAGVGLVVIGDGPERRRLRQQYPEVAWVGSRPHAWRYLLAFDAFASASEAEGCPLAVLEAQAVGLPLALSRIPAHLEVAPRAFFAGPGAAGFADAIRAALSVWPSAWSEENSARLAVTHAPADVARAHRTLYESIRGAEP